MAIDRAIRIARAIRGYTRAELAHRAGLSASYVTLLEQGERRPSTRALADIATATAVPLDVLGAFASGQCSDGGRVLHVLLGQAIGEAAGIGARG